MRLKRLFLAANRSLLNFPKLGRNAISPSPCIHQTVFYTSISSPQHLLTPQIPNFSNPISLFIRKNHSLQVVSPIDTDNEESNSEDDGLMSEFLSHFVWIMKGKLSDAYPDCDKQTINGMLLIIVDKVVEELEKGGMDEMVGPSSTFPSHDLSDDLWNTVWEVSNLVLEDMKKERKKESMKKFMQHEEVKEMCRFASEVGVRGNMLRNFRFKWAKEKMEEVEFYESLERMREQFHAEEREEQEKANRVEYDAVDGEVVAQDGEFVAQDGEVVAQDGSDVGLEVKPKVVSLPQRRGKIKYKIHGLDMSGPEWAEVAFKYHEAEKRIMPEEPKAITGKCKLVTEKILKLTESDDPPSLLAEWVELLKPGRVDWFHLLDKLREQSMGLYFKIAETILDEDSFQANVRDYSRLIDLHAKDNQIDDAERILKKMGEKGIDPDILTTVVLFHMYIKAGNIKRAKEAFVLLRSEGFYLDVKAYSAMLTAYINAGESKAAEALLREMEARDIKPTKEIYMSLLRAFSELGHSDAAHRISTSMNFAGLQPSLESCTLLVEAYARSGKEDKAKEQFEQMKKYGHRPDDRSIACLISLYERKNALDKALNLLIEHEKDGSERGIGTNMVLLEWLSKLGLVDEAEDVLRKITEKGATPSIKAQVGLCAMYAKSGDEKKALQALGIVEGKKDLLDADDFRRMINSLTFAGLEQHAQRLQKMMDARGLSASEKLTTFPLGTQMTKQMLQLNYGKQNSRRIW